MTRNEGHRNTGLSWSSGTTLGDEMETHRRKAGGVARANSSNRRPDALQALRKCN